MKAYPAGIVFVHGIQGSPNQFDGLIRQMPSSVLIRNCLLPGHGTDVRAFRKARAQHWLDAVRTACLDMREQCERIIFVGHSMGGLLGLLTEQEQALFSGMLLIGCPFCIRPTWRYWHNSLLAVRSPGRTDDPFIQAARAANSVSAGCALSYLLCVRPYRDLLKIIRRTKGLTLRLPAATVFACPALDEVVSKRCISYIRNHLKAKAEVLNGCGHHYWTDAAQNRLAAILLNMTSPDR